MSWLQQRMVSLAAISERPAERRLSPQCVNTCRRKLVVVVRRQYFFFSNCYTLTGEIIQEVSPVSFFCCFYAVKRRWQVTTKHAYTLRMWLCMKWHGARLYGVHRMHRDGSRFLWHQPCQRCKYTTSVDIQNRAIKLVTHVVSHASAMSLLESGE